MGRRSNKTCITEHGPQRPGEVWAYEYRGMNLVVVTLTPNPSYDEDGWDALVLDGGAWDYKPGRVMDWTISTFRDGWRRVA